jgi:hypothetical protein
MNIGAASSSTGRPAKNDIISRTISFGGTGPGMHPLSRYLAIAGNASSRAKSISVSFIPPW